MTEMNEGEFSIAEKETVKNEAPAPQDDKQVKPIGEVVDQPDFPRSSIGQWVDIRGVVGLVTDVVNNSLKVKASDGANLSYNFHALRRLYGRAPEHPAIEVPEAKPPAPAEPEVVPENKNVVLNPDFTTPLKAINEYTGQSEFPLCALGAHVDIGGYHGVIVEIAHRSLKVRSREETTRKYNADILKKLYPPNSNPSS